MLPAFSTQMLAPSKATPEWALSPEISQKRGKSPLYEVKLHLSHTDNGCRSLMDSHSHKEIAGIDPKTRAPCKCAFSANDH